MGARGPARKPVALGLVDGDWRSKARAKNTVQAPDAVPELPASVAAAMTAELRSIWDYYLAELVKLRAVSTPDLDALLVFCEAVRSHRRLTAECDREDTLVMGVRGDMRANPKFTMKNQAAQVVRQFSREFGFTPAARADIKVSGDKGSSVNDF